MRTTNKTSKLFILAFSVALFMFSTSFAGVDDLVLQNETIQIGEIKAYTARNSITTGSSFVVENGGDATLRAGTGTVALKPGFHAKKGAKFAVKFWYDAQGPQDAIAPTVVSLYPADGENVANDGSPLELRIIFADDDSGIYSVKLLDENGVDITTQATIGGSYNPQTLSFIITSPVEQTYRYTVVLEDMAGNTVSIDILFTVDNTPPVTTTSLAGGTFTGPFAVTLTCDKAGSTIYYSTDNYPPFVGGSNTYSGVSPITVTIDRSMNMQFFAVDTAGNIEVTKSEIYLLGAIPDAVVNTSGIFDSTGQRVELSWDAASGQISGYHVYRCLSPFDVNILNQSHKGGYPPPASLRISGSLLPTTSYYDSAIVSGVIYYYGVTAVDANGMESAISTLMPVNINGVTSEDSDPYLKATAWLESVQNEQGYWGAKRRLRMLATSQVLNAYKLIGKNDAGTHHALFYLRGHFADNNDYLARKIITLHSYGQNIDEMANRLLAQSFMISANQIAGWGVTTRYSFDAVSTALGSRALDLTTRDISPLHDDAYVYFRFTTYLDSNISDQFSWVVKQYPSVYVSSLVYDVYSESTNFDSTWISDNPNSDGSFGNGIIDTCAVIMWNNNLDTTKHDNAMNYLVDEQGDNGSWDDDPYLTGLCIEALKTSGYAP